MQYTAMPREELLKEKAALLTEYNRLKSLNLKLDMSRGKPSAAQLELSAGMLDILTDENCFTESGLDCRNYGLIDGIPEIKSIFSAILDVPEDNLIVFGNSSLNIMYDEVMRAMFLGTASGAPWSTQNGGKVKFLCPSPGYDRHFGVTQSLGVELITVDMTAEGPDMDAVEALVASDPSIKGIWCVPKYSNPDGIVYSDEVVRRLASLKPAAADFRIFWDNAYVVHDLYDETVSLLNIFDEAKKYGNENMPLIFTSTSKISFPGSGVSALAASSDNIEHTKSIMKMQTIGHDKLNMLRHARFFKNLGGIKSQMKKHAEILRPKFETVLEAFERELAPRGIAEWTSPKGGYFIGLNVLDGCAKRVYALAKDAGVTLTNAGATFPYGIDPRDRNLRIAPSFPPIEELRQAVDVLCVCVRLAAAEKLLDTAE